MLVLLPCVDDFQYPSFSSSAQLLSSKHCSPRTSRPAVGTALSVLLILPCCWLCSSRLLLAVLFCLLLAVLFSPVSVLCLLASPRPALLCGNLLFRGSSQAPPTPLLSMAALRDHWFAVSVRDPQHRSLQQHGLLFVGSGFTPCGLGDSLPLRFVGGHQHHRLVLTTA